MSTTQNARHDVSLKDNAAVDIWACTCGRYYTTEFAALDHLNTRWEYATDDDSEQVTR